MPKVFVNGVSINYTVDGLARNPAVFFSNSLASTLAMWNLQTDELVARGFYVIRYDSRGHGDSDVTAGPYSIEMLADDAAALIEKLDIGPVHFCGLSKGGMVAQMMGSRHPDKVKSLTIADSAAFMPIKEIWEQRIATVTASGMEAIVDGTIERWITAEGRNRLPDQVSLIRKMILETPADGFIACSHAIKNMDMRLTNPLIIKPTLVVCGKDDTGTTPAQAKEIMESIPGAILELIPEAAHLANIEQSEVFNKLLTEHIEKNQ
jgi:3-oxoadipate enol-lactonase